METFSKFIDGRLTKRTYFKILENTCTKIGHLKIKSVWTKVEQVRKYTGQNDI